MKSLAILALTMLLSACGGGDPDDESTNKTIEPVHCAASAQCFT